MYRGVGACGAVLTIKPRSHALDAEMTDEERIEIDRIFAGVSIVDRSMIPKVS